MIFRCGASGRRIRLNKVGKRYPHFYIGLAERLQLIFRPGQSVQIHVAGFNPFSLHLLIRVNQILDDLLKILELERLEINLFRGESRDIGSPQVFGGQVLGQALWAATSTVEPDRLVHSLHAYFLRAGDF